MNTDDKTIGIHKQIQTNLMKMLPEKFRKICLYASVAKKSDRNNKGEMFFYYFPAGILKKNPINVYEIPEIFSIDEEQYSKLEDKLYESIKKLKNHYKSRNNRNWTNLTITISGTKYKVEFYYEDLEKSEFDSLERHIIWRYKYLELPIESFNKDEKKVIKRYFESQEYNNILINDYEENIYEKPPIAITNYNKGKFIKEEEIKQKEQEEEAQKKVKNQLLNF